MLIKPLLTPTASLAHNCITTPPTHHIRKLQSKDFKLQHGRYFSNPQRQHHSLRQCLQNQRQQRCILLLIALIVLQQVEPNACRQLAQRSIHSLSSMDKSTDSSTSDLVNQAQNFVLPQSKRAEFRQSPNVGQPEEIFAVDDRMESNYDEYPMIVPKRSAMLIDRLLVALHNALEKDRETEQRRIGELNPKYKNAKDTDSNADNAAADIDAGLPQLDNMYSDEPAVMLDYDLKDLNSINRATGETFFRKNLQRRAKIGGGDSMAMIATSMATGATTRGTGKSLSGGGGDVGGGGHLNTGRIYWRCYFNAISCF